MTKPELLVAVYDTETNGLLHQLDKMHCIGIKFSDGRYLSCADQPGYMPIVEGIQELEKADIRVAHNALGFDEQVIKMVYPWFKPKPTSRVIDTILLAKLVYPDISRTGPNTHKVPSFMRRSYALKALGLRLGTHKGDYDGGWDTWSPAMQEYMDQDVEVLDHLFKHLMAKKPSLAALGTEHEFAQIIRRQERRGFTFDFDRALSVQAVLEDRSAALETSLIEHYGEWWEHGKTANSSRGSSSGSSDEEEIEDDDGTIAEKLAAKYAVVVVKKTRKVKLTDFPDVTERRISAKTGKELKPYVGPPFAHYEMGAVYTPIRRVQFNPGSRSHVAKMLFQRHGWKPTKFTAPPHRTPVVDDDVLNTLAEVIPEAKQLADYFMVGKRLGQLSHGKGAWLKYANLEEDGQYRIHGKIDTIGTVTFRCSHSAPNVAQTVANHNEYGHDFRSLWIARKGMKLVGYDGSSLQLRLLAHYLAKIDGGEYAKIVHGSDPHAWARDTIGLDLFDAHPDDTEEMAAAREKAKRIVYAMLFGSGLPKLGSIILPHANFKRQQEIGHEIKERLAVRFGALQELENMLAAYFETNGYIPGLDGRRLSVRKVFAILNTLLMSAEAIVMKVTKIKADTAFQRALYVPGRDYEFVADIHDEHQLECLPEIVPSICTLATSAHADAGDHLKLRCPMVAKAKVGESWADTH